MPTIISASDASNAASDSASKISGSQVSDIDGSHADDSGRAAAVGSGQVVNNLPFAASIPGYLPGSFTNYGLSYSNHGGVSFTLPQETGVLTAHLPFALSSYFGPENGSSSPNYVTGVDWEINVFSGTTLTYMTSVPRYQSASFNFAISNEGAGQIVIDRSDPIFTERMGTGGPGTDLFNEENIWQFCYNGAPIFEFLGTTVDEIVVDASSEASPVTISGAGTARTLSWGKAFPPGFPNVVYKLGSLIDSFQLTAIDTTTWNLTSTSDINNKLIYVDGNSAAAIVGSPTNYLSSPALASGWYDATSSALSAKITPLNMPSQPTNLSINGSFVLGLTNWDTGGSVVQTAGASANVYTSDSVDGDGFCAQVTTTGSGQGIEQEVPALLPNSYYQFNAWVKLQSAGNASPQLVIYDETNSRSCWLGYQVAQVGEWVLMQAAIWTGGLANVSMLCSVNSGNSTTPMTFLVDNVCLFQYTPYTSNATILTSANDPDSYVMMELDFFDSNNRFVARSFKDGALENEIYLTTTYDPVEHAFWRIREYNKQFYFDTAPDGGTWTNQGMMVYDWDATNVSVSFTCWYYGFYGSEPGFTPMEVSGINSNGSPAPKANGTLQRSANAGSLASGGFNINAASSAGLQNAYLEVPNAAIFLDLLNQCKTRGTLIFIEPLFDAVNDSTGVPWSDQASLIITNGSDLESQLQSSAAAFNGDWVMYPNFQLWLGNDGSLGTDRSQDVIFYSSGQIVLHDRTRARDQISNYIVASDTTGNLTYQTNPSSIASWNQRENYVQSSQATDIATLEQLANATLIEFQNEVSQRTLQVPPDLPGRTVFIDYQLGDWIGVQNANLTDVDSVRVVGISISIDGTQDYVTLELTLETRIELLIERMNTLLQKIGMNADAQVIAPTGASSITVQQTVNSAQNSNNYTQILGDGSTTVYNIGHALETQNVHVTVRDNGTGSLIAAGTGIYTVVTNGIDTVTITFASAPTTNQYTAVVSK